MDSATFEYQPGPETTVGVLLLHPHPDMGGNRFNHVIDALFRLLPTAGVGVARFDLSSSEIPRARSDTVEAMRLVADSPVALVGYSFGAEVALGIDDQRAIGWCAIAPPLQIGDFSAVSSDSRPKALLVAERDQFAPPARVRQTTSAWDNTTVTTISDADHFLVGHSASVAAAVLAWVGGLIAAPGTR